MEILGQVAQVVFAGLLETRQVVLVLSLCLSVHRLPLENSGATNSSPKSSSQRLSAIRPHETGCPPDVRLDILQVLSVVIHKDLSILDRIGYNGLPYPDCK
ncbi:MAG: hypothetical protein BroJett011_22130 [Chloroflexota bacterium]|nr:MAG: hypothetical protein BroJett011_22130 [Chloroflexota bacterium]